MTKKGHKRKRGWLLTILSILFFPLAILYEEVLLKACVAETPVFDKYFIYIFLFSVAFGLLLWLLSNLFKARKTMRVILSVILGIVAAIFSAEYCCKQFFKTFFEVSYMLNMTGEVAGDFASQAFAVIFSNIPFILATFVPMAALIVFRKILIPDRRIDLTWDALIFLLIVAFQLSAVLLVRGSSEDREYYTSQFSASSAIPRFGLVTDLRLELTYGIFGIPEEEDPGEDISWPMEESEESSETSRGEESENSELPAVVYKDNVMDIDFRALLESTNDETLQSMHKYFGTMAPTAQNEYTGMFKGKNLIYLCAEGFSPYVIDPQLTPTLYRLSHEGFVFNNYYQPDWTQSTTGGEFAAMTGLIPTWINGRLSFRMSAKNSMPLALGNQFSQIGYKTLAYHNNTYTYYGRDETHPNLGYDYKGIGNGLNLAVKYGWPNSDLEMMKATMGEYINNYVYGGQNFHAYYMTVSGHCNYGWNANKMSEKNRAAVEGLNYSETIKAYLACQLELEYALQYIMQVLDANGIAEDTVIVMTADHYPYALNETQTTGVDYYNELEPYPTTEKDTDRYRNTLIIWSGCMEKPVEVNVPCSSIDIVPTLSNLFGLEYDSRLLSGRDILATNYDVSDPDSRQPFVVFADKGGGNCWISEAGTYNAFTKTFTPAAGYESYKDNKDYISAMSRKASNMYKYAKYIITKDYYSVVLGDR